MEPQLSRMLHRPKLAFLGVVLLCGLLVFYMSDIVVVTPAVLRLPPLLTNSTTSTSQSITSTDNWVSTNSVEVVRKNPFHCPSSSPSNFSSWLSSFPWTNFVSSSGSSPLIDRLIQDLTPFLIKEPLLPINTSCVPPLIPSPQSLPCPGQFTPRARIPRIAVLIQFGFDVDTLEIYFHELYDIVDKFFILESTRSHHKGLRKPLIWEKVRNQARFSEFQDKTVQIILDDIDTEEVVLNASNDPSTDAIWQLERYQERMRWIKFLEWNNVRKEFTESDLLGKLPTPVSIYSVMNFQGFGDADEIPSRSTILQLKHCEPSIDPVDIGIWFPYGRIDQAFQTDWPVPGEVYSMGDPTYWRLGTALSLPPGQYPSRNRGSSPNHLLGGVHLTHYGYLPFQIVKRLTQTESGREEVGIIGDLAQSVVSGRRTLREMEIELAEPPSSLKYRIHPLANLKGIIEQIAVLPWFYDCNRGRYPAWEGNHDSRIY